MRFYHLFNVSDRRTCEIPISIQNHVKSRKFLFESMDLLWEPCTPCRFDYYEDNKYILYGIQFSVNLHDSSPGMSRKISISHFLKLINVVRARISRILNIIIIIVILLDLFIKLITSTKKWAENIQMNAQKTKRVSIDLYQWNRFFFE